MPSGSISRMVGISLHQLVGGCAVLSGANCTCFSEPMRCAVRETSSVADIAEPLTETGCREWFHWVHLRPGPTGRCHPPVERPLASADKIDVGVQSANVTFSGAVDFLLDFDLSRHVRPIRDHGHDAVGPNANEVCVL